MLDRVVQVLIVAAAVLLLGASARASSSDDVTFTGSRVHVSASTVVSFRALARHERAEHVAAEESEEAPEPEGKDENEEEEPEPNVHFTVPSPLVAPLSLQTRGSVASPYVSGSFLAQPDAPAVGTSKNETPPDTNGAVGRDKLMVPLNSNYVIQRKSDGAILSRISMTAFWKPVGAHNPFDPRVLYDPYSDRWLVSAADDPLLASSLILYGISDTADPLGTWHLYAIHADETGATWADFPTLGFSRTTVAIGVNMFNRSSLNYVRGRLIVLDFAPLRGGTGGNPVGIDVPGAFALQPAVTNSPTEATLYLVENLDSLSATYRFWSLNGTTLTLVGGRPGRTRSAPGPRPAPSTSFPSQGVAGSARATRASATRSSATATSGTRRRSVSRPAARATRSAPPSSGWSSTRPACSSRAAGSWTRGPIPGTAGTRMPSGRSRSTPATTSSSASPSSSPTTSRTPATRSARAPTHPARWARRSRSRTVRGST